MNLNLSSIDIKDKKTQVFILIGLVSVLAVIIYFSFILMPQVDRVFEAVGQASKIGADLKEAQYNISNIPKFKASIAAYEEKIDRYEKMLPTEQEIPALLENLSGMAKNSNIKIVGIMPVITKEDKTKKAAIYQEKPILINAKSGYHELGKFLSSMENADRFMKVSDIQIKAGVQSSKRHDVELTVLTYTLTKGK